jgi:hypothetical protein
MRVFGRAAPQPPSILFPLRMPRRACSNARRLQQPLIRTV